MTPPPSPNLVPCTGSYHYKNIHRHCSTCQHYRRYVYLMDHGSLRASSYFLSPFKSDPYKCPDFIPVL